MLAIQLDSMIRSSFDNGSDEKPMENFSDSDDDEFNVPQENIEFAVSGEPTNFKASSIIQQTQVRLSASINDDKIKLT